MWQDMVILMAQGAMLVALIPTVSDRSRWPHPFTAAVTGAALYAVAGALASLGLIGSPIVVFALGCAWMIMAFG